MKARPPAVRVFAVIAVGMAVAIGFDSHLSSQTEQKVDFTRDVQPLLKERCIRCHGPSQQMNGYRLDRRSAALGGVIRHNIVAGSSESSRLYQRLIGSQVGPQMPPTGPLAPNEIAMLKQWIDEGADWPDTLANEADLPPPDADATRAIEAIRRSDAAGFNKLGDLRSIVNRRGPGGSTPLMHAALYGDAGLVAEMLHAGADPNLRNYAGASALMWALEDTDTIRVLLDGGADVNATSDFDRTPLSLAAAQTGSARVVKLLLDHGATPSPAALASAALRGDSTVFRLLLGAGVRDTTAAATAALRANCRECLDAIAGATPRPAPLRNALNNLLPVPGPGNPQALRDAIDRGADVNVKDPKSRTVLMRAAIVEMMPPEVVQLLIDRGADVHAKTPEGLTALDFAKRLGNAPVVDVLLKAGATTTSSVEPTMTFVRGNTIRDAAQRTLPLLQRTALQFYKKSGCVSCHHNSLTEMTVAAARSKGLAVDERAARDDLMTVVNDIETTPDQALQGIVIAGGSATTTGYMLMGLSAEGHPPDLATDALVRLLRLSQHADGHWLSAYRPPFESSEFTATTVSLRGIQLYGSGTRKEANEKAIRAAASWLMNASPQTTEDRVFRLLGLTWTDASPTVRQTARQDLVATQHADGGWAQLPSLASDAYATGEALFALSEAGMRTTDAVYRRGVQFLLKTQLIDGSWFVRTRSHPAQIYFESGFPHGLNQYISAAATNWATLALIRAHPDKMGDLKR